mmetsp:Transcript_7970/g.16201  ORF Transcript_7970/g.16201 Transcript_7970/m.16201 type:complete len:90 (+) Transcript_7970:568-837(+)|eukprot:CAMPEP_0170337376 /NCGR_PEP_ID=MMETSP0116_2-20130129/69734_1 /TAXON_ID=400756 /ORGANISM="Durinskia baltica, Strain CSIRO CS-38" /LENGTH=89 /DNA_ID=CAMNT_0010590771 /DNA_START=476 /DNA_END=745 /DNA_ORIENTATION=-
MCSSPFSEILKMDRWTVMLLLSVVSARRSTTNCSFPSPATKPASASRTSFSQMKSRTGWAGPAAKRSLETETDDALNGLNSSEEPERSA